MLQIPRTESLKIVGRSGNWMAQVVAHQMDEATGSANAPKVC